MILFAIPVFLLLLAVRLWGAHFAGGYLDAAGVTAFNHALNMALVVAAGFVADGLIRYFYWHRYWRRHRNRETPALIRDILTVAILLLTLSVGLWWQEGVSFAGLITASGATAVILGIALQAVIQDLFSGLSINLEGSYGLGDWLTVYSEQLPEPIYGQVSAMTWRSTYLTQLDGRSLMVPNHMITANPVLNHSRPATAKRLTVEIPVDVRVPSAHVGDILLGEAFKAVRGHRLATLPAPSVHIHRLDSDSAFYQVYFYADPALVSPDLASAEMYRALLEAVQRHALPMPVTQVEMTEKPQLDFRVGQSQVEEALCGAMLFRDVLNDDQRAALAQKCLVRKFAAREALMLQDDGTASMFIILSGAARVTIHGEGGEHEVAVLAMGDVVGEMSLMTGAPRSATVTAMTAVKALEITKDSMAELLQASPELMRNFSEVLARRQAELHRVAHRAAQKPPDAGSLLVRMKTFFRIGARPA